MSISIVMISFNQVEFLEIAIASVLDQELVDLELIIVDPGSTDGSRELVEHIAGLDNRVILIFEPDNGPSDGLNKGFRRAQNEIIGYLNSDDFYLPSSLKNVEIAFNSNPQADVIYGHGLILDLRKDLKLKFAYSDNPTVIKLAANTLRMMQQSTFFRKESIDDAMIRFNTQNITCWDFEFVVDALLSKLRFVKINDVLSVFRIHSKSVSGSGARFEQYQKDRNRVAAKFTDKNFVTRYKFHHFYAVLYRIIRKTKEIYLQIKLSRKIKEFEKECI